MNNTNQPEKTSTTRSLLLILASIIFAWLMYQIWDSDVVYKYRAHWSSDRELKLDFKDLNANLIESDIKTRYKLNWRCLPDKQLPDFGNWICVDTLKSWNGISVFNVVFWFKQDKLSVAKIDVPLFQHANLIKHLKSNYGPPVNFSENENRVKYAKNIAFLLLSRGTYQPDKNMQFDKLGVWELPNRARITTSLDNDTDPTSHNTVLWQAY